MVVVVAAVTTTTTAFQLTTPTNKVSETTLFATTAGDNNLSTTRRNVLGVITTAAGIVTGATGGLSIQPAQPAYAAATTTKSPKQSMDEKQLNLSNEDIGKIVKEDIVDRQFLVTGDFTRSIYDESATFQDEIDTYQLDQWIIGVKRLFIPSGSHITLLEDTFKVTNDEITFKFSEYLQFNLRVAKPTLSLTGTLILKRSPETGLITSYKEIWDQDINTVLKSAKF